MDTPVPKTTTKITKTKKDRNTVHVDPASLLKSLGCRVPDHRRRCFGWPSPPGVAARCLGCYCRSCGGPLALAWPGITIIWPKYRGFSTPFTAGKSSVAGMHSGRAFSTATLDVKAVRLDNGARAKQVSPSWDVSMSLSKPLEPLDFDFSAQKRNSSHTPGRRYMNLHNLPYPFLLKALPLPSASLPGDALGQLVRGKPTHPRYER